jgi:hypothetical protein
LAIVHFFVLTRMAALRMLQFYAGEIAWPITFVLKLNFGQEMLPKSRLGQGNFLQRDVNDDWLHEGRARHFDTPQLPVVQY